MNRTEIIQKLYQKRSRTALKKKKKRRFQIMLGILESRFNKQVRK